MCGFSSSSDGRLTKPGGFLCKEIIIPGISIKYTHTFISKIIFNYNRIYFT